jgi:hypothetical protein
LIDSIADHLFPSGDGDYDLGYGARIKIASKTFSIACRLIATEKG